MTAAPPVAIGSKHVLIDTDLTGDELASLLELAIDAVERGPLPPARLDAISAAWDDPAFTG